MLKVLKYSLIFSTFFSSYVSAYDLKHYPELSVRSGAERDAATGRISLAIEEFYEGIRDNATVICLIDYLLVGGDELENAQEVVEDTPDGSFKIENTVGTCF